MIKNSHNKSQKIHKVNLIKLAMNYTKEINNYNSNSNIIENKITKQKRD